MPSMCDSWQLGLRVWIGFYKQRNALLAVARDSAMLLPIRDGFPPHSESLPWCIAALQVWRLFTYISSAALSSSSSNVVLSSLQGRLSFLHSGHELYATPCLFHCWPCI